MSDRPRECARQLAKQLLATGWPDGLSKPFAGAPRVWTVAVLDAARAIAATARASAGAHQ